MPAFADFIDRLSPDDITVLSTYENKLVYTLQPGRFTCYDTTNKLYLDEVDFVVMRGSYDQLHYVSRFCAYNNVPIMNDYSLYYNGTKVAQTVIFLEEEVPFIPTIFSIDHQLLIDAAEHQFGYPFILKTSKGSHGDSNYLIKNRQKAEQIVAAEPGVPFIAQEYCPNDFDYRFLVAGNQHLVFERRGEGDSHLNNTSKGGGATVASSDLPQEIITGAHRVAKRLGLNIAGIDVVPNRETGQHYFLEVNSQPQIRTGALLGEKDALVASFLANPQGGVGSLNDS